MSDPSSRVSIWPVAIWDGSQWIEAARVLWPSGTAEHVIVEVEPALGVLNVGTIVLGAEAFDELARAEAGDFGEDPRLAWLVIGIRSDLSRATARKRKLERDATQEELERALRESMGMRPHNAPCGFGLDGGECYACELASKAAP